MNIRKRTWVTYGVKKSAWLLDWRPARGGRLRRQFRTRQEADLFYQKLLREHRAQEYGTLVDRITFGEFLAIYEKKKPWRTDTYRERVMISLEKAFAKLRDVLLTDITPALVERLRDERLEGKTWAKRKRAPSTVRQDLAALSDCLAWAVKLHYLHENPAARVSRPALLTKQDDPATYLPLEDLGKLLAVAEQDRPLYEVAVATGLRETELLELTWPDIRDGFVVVRRGKGRKQRMVPLIPQGIEAFQTVPKRLKEPRVFWWLHSRYEVYKRFRRRLRWAGLSGYRFHDLRHTFASYAAMSGVDLRVIGDCLGHSQTSVTRRYAHLSPDYRRQEIQKMAKFWSAGTREAHGTYKRAKT